MKNKITKLSLAVFLMSAISLSAQTDEERSKIVSLSNTSNLEALVAKKTAEFEERYALAVEKALEKGLPISGVNEKGQFFTVHSYEPESDIVIYRKTFNNSGTASSINTIGVNYMHENGILGQDMIAGIWDGGVPLVNHVALSPRVTVKDNGNTGMQPQGIYHATHVGGTIASSGSGAADLNVTKGMAPSGRLWAYNWNNDEAEMIAAAGQGLLVSNHSYGLDNEQLKQAFGVGIFGRYTSTSASIDEIHNDFPYYLSVWAAGNDRDLSPALNPGYGGRDILVHEGTSKNNVVVAAINGIANYTNASSVQMSSFSNWGPTDDFRIKPDISAKGVNVTSLSNQSAVAIGTEQGTSMASPSVTGGFLLWQQYHHQLFGNYMRASTVRALMAHTAKEAGPQIGPDHMYGWGVLNIEGGALVMENVAEEKAVIEELTLNNNDVIEIEIETLGGSPLVATIAWNDPAGTPIGSGTNLPMPRLVNDVDLRIVNVDTNQEFLPYMLNRTWPQLAVGSTINTKGDNIADNIEKVEIVGAPAGNYKVVISHKGTLTGGSQIVSLIITGHQGALSVEDEALSALKLFPNPATDFVTIEGDYSILQNAELAVYDQTGRLVDSAVLKYDSDFKINTSEYPSGIYMFTLSKNGATKSYKVVKK